MIEVPEMDSPMHIIQGVDETEGDNDGKDEGGEEEKAGDIGSDDGVEVMSGLDPVEPCRSSQE